MTTLDLGGLTSRLGDLGLGPIPDFPEPHMLNKPLDIGRSYLADILRNLVQCDLPTAYNCIQWPNDIFTADLTVPLPRLNHGADPTAFAMDLMERFPECPLFIFPLQDGVHLRIMFRSNTLPRLLLPYIDDRKETYGRDTAMGLRDPASPDLGCKKLVIEFSSPNIGSEFHGKHLRSTIIGAYIANLYTNMGWDVVKVNYLGDWGKHIGLLGAGWERFGSEEQFQADPVGHMLGVYNQIDELFRPEQAASRAARDKGEDPASIENQGLFAERNAFFKRMEEGDEQAITLWKRFRDVSIEHYTTLYRRLNVSFDEYSGESQFNPDTIAEIEDMLKNKGLSEESDRSWVVDLNRHTGKPGRVIIRDRNGSGTYALRELATVLDRSRKYSFDKMIYVVADDHNMHFQRIKKILELMDMSDLAHKLEHVHFNKSSQMSEVVGQGHMLGGVLDQCQNAMVESLRANPDKAALLGDTNESAAALGVSALLAQELSAKRASHHSFAIDQMTAFERGTGPELQYWHAKLCSILETTNSNSSALSDEDFAPVEKGQNTDLLRLLAQYPDVTSLAYEKLEPPTVMNYLVSITDQLSMCLESKLNPAESEDALAEAPAEAHEQRAAEVPEEVQGEGPGEIQDQLNLTPAETVLFEAVRQVLENGMKLLGITPVTRYTLSCS
ncbi:arginine-tRNA ligase [Rhinocladiella mackenziei CBS 650.93]|uniref:arginine--tRNA ligase n=1 Tax=Rhinocladiella mackenziei CBS 650.93 TaxID=1442369 RepID=A0A0D2H0N2_9EURO|nr:arginine-tRNA ligase [Rhinocladiella mackenziei CBS 650.93]KIX03973.1 arginine-tRNA ligase [Rhinocladiella mackenziei CBS 650.93]